MAHLNNQSSNDNSCIIDITEERKSAHQHKYTTLLKLQILFAKVELVTGWGREPVAWDVERGGFTPLCRNHRNPAAQQLRSDKKKTCIILKVIFVLFFVLLLIFIFYFNII